MRETAPRADSSSVGPYPVEEPDRSLGDLTGRLVSEMGGLLNDHALLARTEIVADLKDAGRGVGFMGGGALAAWLAALFFSFAAAWGLAEAVETWIAFLAVGGLWAIAAAVMAATGKRQLDGVDPVPTETMQELEKDKEWMSGQRN